MGSTLKAPGGAQALAETKAGKAAASIHALDKAEEIAKRVKDPGALEDALVGKLDHQRDFAAEYTAKFPQGVRADRRGDSAVASSLGADWCLGFGFHVRTVQRWLDLLDGDKYTGKKSAILKRCWQLAEMWQSASYSSETNEWYTPALYLEAVRRVLGRVDLDPASNAKANKIVQAEKIFTQKDDGLSQKWFGRVFLNPPYGRTPDGKSLAAAFCNKAVEQFNAGNIEAGIILVNSLHSQSWQKPLYDYAVCFVDHRIHFVSGDGEENENPTFQNIFVYLGTNRDKFAQMFAPIGYVMARVP